MIKRFATLSNNFLQQRPNHNQFQRFVRQFSSSSNFDLQRKLHDSKLTKKEVEFLIKERQTFEDRLDELERKVASVPDMQKMAQMRQQQTPAQGLVNRMMQSGSSRNAPLFIERVGEKKWQSFFSTIVFWVIILSVWFHFQRGQNSIQNMFDDNYTEFDEIHWEDDDDEEKEGDEEESEPTKTEEPQTWRDRILTLFGISVADRESNSKDEKKSRKRKQKRVTFANVCGCDEAKEDLQDIVYYLKHPEDFKQMGIKLPKGVLLEGPPGTGKTLMARALAGEAGVPFLSTNGSAFDQIFVGVGVMRVKNLFERAVELAPSIIFIDEVDAIGSSRGAGSGVSPHASDSLNALLVEMDGFNENNGVVVLAATNMAQNLDNALVRAGRFDRTIRVGLPDREQRVAIIKMYLKDNGDGNVCIEDLISDLAGFSGADLANIVNLAGIEAVKDKRDKISMADLVEAKETVAMGRARKSMKVPQHEKDLTAYHEGGHAVVALYTEAANLIYKATLMPRGSALGMVTFTNEDEYSRTYEGLLAQMDVGMGGRAAEELIFGTAQMTTGASSDFNQATRIATAMVCQYGMSDVGRVFYDPNNLHRLSPDLQNMINSEVKRLLDESYARAIATLEKHRPELELLAQALLKRETLSVTEIKEVLKYQESDKESPFKADAKTVPPTRPRKLPKVEEPQEKEPQKEQKNKPDPVLLVNSTPQPSLDV